MKWLPIIQTILLAAIVILMIPQSPKEDPKLKELKEEVAELQTVRDSLKGQLREADTILTQIKNEEITIDSADSIIANWERTRLR